MWRSARIVLALLAVCILGFLGYGLVSQPEPPTERLVLTIDLDENR